MTAPPPAYDLVHVVVPAHDEEDLLPACLASLSGAVAELRAARPHVQTRVTVVADACTDGSSAVARLLDADVLEVGAGNVGHARRAGVRRVLELATGIDPSRVWVASTDADTRVPGHWLLAQLRLAEAGHAMVVGSVHPERRGLDPRLWRAWLDRHPAREGHRHVHGANLGLSLDAYLQVGGFPAVPLHEDVLLVEAVRRSGLPWCATDTTRVTTSARRSGRLVGGFADYLDGLDDPASAS
jgi:glycosyltransferase involved in cell wall biosynthesis